MEKKKLLLVSVAVGLFLVIAIGASVLVFSPRDYYSVTKVDAEPVRTDVSRVATESLPQTPQVQLPEITQSVSVQPADSDVQIQAVTEAGTESRLENIIYITAGGITEEAVRVERLNDGNTATYITIPTPRENSGTTTTTPPATTTTTSAPPAATTTTAAPATVVAAPPAAAPAATQKPATPKSNAPAKAQTVGTDSFWWVQTNSYSQKAYADNARKFLETKGITSVVTNGNVGGKTYYRVRVGPYASQAEADYWLALIKTIEGMENSLVWKSSSL
jgi:DedD protein